MRKEWSKNWISSKQPRKQRKYRYNAPLHVRHKFVSAHMSKDLIRQHGRRAFPVRKGDEVEVTRGEFAGFKGVVNRVNLSSLKVYVEGVTVKKVDGSEVLRALEPSNLRITKLILDDKFRLKAINRKKESVKPIEKAGTKKEKHEATKK